MLSYIIRRLLLIVPTLIGITAVVFFVMALAPGGVGASLISHEGEMKPQERKALKDYLEKRYGLDQPPYVQYFRWLHKVSPIGAKEAATEIRPSRVKELFGRFQAEGDSPQQAVEKITAALPGAGPLELGPGGYTIEVPALREGQGWPINWRFGLKPPDLGESFARQRPVAELILEALPITLLLNLISIPIVYGIAILTGIQAAKHRGKLADVASGTFLLGLWSLPSIFVGVLLIGVFANEKYFRWFPTNGLHDIQAPSMPFLPHHHPTGGWERGWLLDTLWHLALPVLCLSYGSFAFLSKLQRSALLENIAQDYVRTARAKGLSEKVVLYGHVFRNSLIPLITVGAHLLPGLLASSVIVERIFGVPGMGNLMVEAAFARDRELVLSDALIIGMVGLVSYLLADIGYVIADPRVSFD